MTEVTYEIKNKSEVCDMNQDVRAALAGHFGFMFEEELLDEMARLGKLMAVPAGEILIDIGAPFVGMPLLLEGAIKIIKEDDSEHELLLYYLEAGDTCAMSLSCCLGKKKSKIRAIAEDESKLVMLPVQEMNEWLSRFNSWKMFVFESIQVRMDELLEAIDSIAFMKLDERLLKYLRDKAKVLGATKFTSTHREIATDLNTSRVVVSRILKQMEAGGLVKVGRNELELLSIS
ncbi:MAG: Crp/Fnr family transcriptional regulator [Bacteroidota bacterium]